MIRRGSMSTDTGSETISALSPEEAFSVLGDETRLEILQALGDADEPLAFSEVFERVEYRDPSNFNYHLKKLAGHFVRETDDGYDLRQAGRRVVEAILSGAVTDAPVIERTRIDRSCQHCGADSIEMEYVEEQVGVYCPRCAGQYGETSETDEGTLPAERERIGHAHLPPAGIRDRTPAEVVEAAYVWTVTQAQALHRGVCPRCSAPVDDSVIACEEHDADGVCDACDRRYAIVTHSECTNCPFELGGSAIGYLHTNPDLLAFLFDHGFDPLSSVFPSTLEVATFEEELRGTDPFEARFTFAIDGDELALTVDGDLDVVDATVR